MRYTTSNVRQLTNRKGKPWQARLKCDGKWKELTKMLAEAEFFKGKKIIL